MRVAFFIPKENETSGEILQRFIECSPVYRSLEIYLKFIDFSQRVARLPRALDTVVLASRTLEQLSALVSIKDYLDGVSVILLLPDMEKETIAMAHILRPKYMDYYSGDFSRIGAVLQKMAGRNYPDSTDAAVGESQPHAAQPGRIK